MCWRLDEAWRVPPRIWHTSIHQRKPLHHIWDNRFLSCTTFRTLPLKFASHASPVDESCMQLLPITLITNYLTHPFFDVLIRFIFYWAHDIFRTQTHLFYFPILSLYNLNIIDYFLLNIVLFPNIVNSSSANIFDSQTDNAWSRLGSGHVNSSQNLEKKQKKVCSHWPQPDLSNERAALQSHPLSIPD